MQLILPLVMYRLEWSYLMRCLSEIIVNNCEFLNISLFLSTEIFDQSIQGNITITNTDFFVTEGSIYRPVHDFKSVIIFENVSITSSMLHHGSELLYFGPSDVINFYNVEYQLIYNGSKCDPVGIISDYDTISNETCFLYRCQDNPRRVIHNAGEV